MPSQFPELPFRIGLNSPSLYYETSQQHANTETQRRSRRRRAESVLKCEGIRLKTLDKEDDPLPLLDCTALEENARAGDSPDPLPDQEKRSRFQRTDDNEMAIDYISNPITALKCTKEEYDRICKFFYLSDYKRNIGLKSGSKLPLIHSVPEGSKFISGKASPHREAQKQLWQKVPFITWDRVQIREPVTKPGLFSTLPDAKKPIIQPFYRKYRKDGEYIHPDEHLLNLIRENKLRPELSKPYPGYTGSRAEIFEWNSQKDRIKKKETYNVYKSTAHITHRPLPLCEDKIMDYKHRGDLSRTVSVLYPFHPYQDSPSRTGEWQNPLDQPKW